MTGYDAVPWLLEEDNPSVRFLALRTILDRPADDPEACSAQARIPSWGPALRILAAQWAEGYWMQPGRGHSPRHKGTMWQVIFLAALGAPLNDVIGRACEHILEHGLPDGRFSACRTDKGAFPCLNGNLLRAFLQLGYQDSRIEEGLEAIAQAVSRDSFRCSRNITGPPSVDERHGQPCAWGAIKVLGALAEVPAPYRTPVMRAASEAGVYLLLEGDLAAGHGPTGTEPRPRWLEFGFPLAEESDLLEALEVLGRLGVDAGPRLDPALNFVLCKQDLRGRWRLEHTPANTWASFGGVGQANKWVTWRALDVLDLWQECKAAAGRPLG